MLLHEDLFWSLPLHPSLVLLKFTSQCLFSKHDVAKVAQLPFLYCISEDEWESIFSKPTCWFFLLSFRDDLRSLLQHHNSKASILLLSFFVGTHDSQPYVVKEKKNSCAKKSEEASKQGARNEAWVCMLSRWQYCHWAFHRMLYHNFKFVT